MVAELKWLPLWAKNMKDMCSATKQPRNIGNKSNKTANNVFKYLIQKKRNKIMLRWIHVLNFIRVYMISFTYVTCNKCNCVFLKYSVFVALVLCSSGENGPHNNDQWRRDTWLLVWPEPSTATRDESVVANGILTGYECMIRSVW